jgi:hypothetical protein
VAWQATTFAAVAILVGLPVGIAAGRWAWRLTAEQLGVATPPVTPLLPVLAVAAGTVVTANLVAAPPGWVAGHLRPAPVLPAPLGNLVFAVLMGFLPVAAGIAIP